MTLLKIIDFHVECCNMELSFLDLCPFLIMCDFQNNASNLSLNKVVMDGFLVNLVQFNLTFIFLEVL